MNEVLLLFIFVPEKPVRTIFSLLMVIGVRSFFSQSIAPFRFSGTPPALLSSFQLRGAGGGSPRACGSFSQSDF